MAQPLKFEEAEEVTINELARQCLAWVKPKPGESPWVSAAREMRKRIDGDSKLKAELLEPLLDAAIWNAVSAVGRAERSVAFHSAGMLPDVTQRGDRLLRVARARAEDLFGFTLEGGIPLRDATRPQVRNSRERYEALSKENGHRGRWLALVEEALPDDVTPVGKVVTADDLERWHKEAETK